MSIVKKYTLAVLLILCSHFGWGQNVLDSVVKNNGYDTTVYDEEVLPYEDVSVDTEVVADRENIINDTFVWKQVQDTTVTALKNSKDFEYANDPEYWKRKEVKTQEDDYSFSFLSADWFSSLGIVIIVLILLFVVYKLVVNNSLFDFGSRKSTASQEIAIEEVDLDQNNINERMRVAETEKKYELYLRLAYIKALFILNDQGALIYDKQSTNASYLFKMRQHRLYNEFRNLTYINDYIAYGGFEVSESLFVKLKEEFQNFYSKVNL